MDSGLDCRPIQTVNAAGCVSRKTRISFSVARYRNPYIFLAKLDLADHARRNVGEPERFSFLYVHNCHKAPAADPSDSPGHRHGRQVIGGQPCLKLQGFFLIEAVIINNKASASGFFAAEDVMLAFRQ